MNQTARRLADSHYSRQSPGSAKFCPPGNKVVLIAPDGRALWVSHRPDPRSGVRRRDGFEYWDNPYFRREPGAVGLASEMIVQAIRITLHEWSKDALPRDGFHSFIDPRHVKPMMRRGVEMWGYSYLMAGFELWPARTKRRGLLRFVFSREKLETLEPLAPGQGQFRLAI
jgi:hypothetical protein